MFTRLTNALLSGLSLGALRMSLAIPRPPKRDEAAPLADALGHVLDHANIDSSLEEAVEDALLPTTPATSNSLVDAVDQINAMRADEPLPTARFKEGDPVEWTSSNVRKVGIVTHVIPAGVLPSDLGVKLKDATSPRDEESYVCKAYKATSNGDAASRGTAYYWPRVSLLNRT